MVAVGRASTGSGNALLSSIADQRAVSAYYLTSFDIERRSWAAIERVSRRRRAQLELEALDGTSKMDRHRIGAGVALIGAHRGYSRRHSFGLDFGFDSGLAVDEGP